MNMDDMLTTGIGEMTKLSVEYWNSACQKNTFIGSMFIEWSNNLCSLDGQTTHDY